MTFTAIQKLTTEQVEKLHADAKAGKAGAVADFVRFSVWRKINKAPGVTLKAKQKAYREVMKKIKITVVL